MILALLNDNLAIMKFAVSEGKRVNELIKREDDDIVIYLVRNNFNWRINVANRTVGTRLYNYALPITDYLNVPPPLDPHWKLCNRLVANGYVLLQKNELARLVEEKVKDIIISKIKELKNMINEDEVPNIIKDVVEDLKSEISKRKPKVSYTISIRGEGHEELYPPCIRQMLADLKMGKNLPHMARFTITSFLLSIGKSVDEIIDLFRNLPDFKENMTRYQVEHIAGLRGSRTKYKPPSCAKLRSYGLCPGADRICSRIKHPLSYYYIALRMRGKMEESK